MADIAEEDKIIAPVLEIRSS